MVDLVIIAIPGAIGCALSHILVCHLIIRAIPELSQLPREIRNAVLSRLDDIPLPSQIKVKRVLLLYSSLFGILTLGIICSVPWWLIGIVYGVAIPIVMVSRFHVAKKYFIQGIRDRLSKVEASNMSD